MKKLISLALLCSMTMGMCAGDIASADADKCCNSCNTCPTTTTTCNSCSSCGCKTALTEAEEAAGEQRCACGKPKPVTKADVGTTDAEKCCNSCNTCPTTTTTCCNSCGCKTALTQEEEKAGVQRCNCGKPKPGRSEVGTTDAEKCCNSCNTCPTTTTTTCSSCNSCGCKTVLTQEEEAAGVQRCACSKPVGGKPGTRVLAKATVAKAMKKNQ